jgi:pimeloyl-ACP methyl ester carboxylesterase
MKSVTSKDGTTIAFERSGRGPSLIIIGGSLADHQFYQPLVDQLAKHFTVYNFDRRGRGQSGDAGDYAVEREIEDVATLVDHAEEPVYMCGHSAGSALALRAAAAGLNIKKLALADPPYTPHSENDESAKAQYAEEAGRIQELNAKGDYKGSAKLFLSGYGLSDEDLEGMFHSPGGESMIDCARALPYDYAMLGDELVPTELAAKVRVPTLVLAPQAMPETAQALVSAMPNARFQAMEAPMHEMPAADLAEKIRSFFNTVVLNF